VIAFVVIDIILVVLAIRAIGAPSVESTLVTVTQTVQQT
jgi:hypothetical protein